MKEKLKQVLGKGKVAVLAVAVALTVGTASTALAANGQARPRTAATRRPRAWRGPARRPGSVSGGSR